MGDPETKNDISERSGSEIYDRYLRKFKDRNYAIGYQDSFTLKSISNALNRKKLIGWIVSKFEIRAIIKLLNLSEGGLIIDVPCGSGKLFPELFKKDCSLVGIDASGEMLSIISNSSHHDISIIQADIRNLPLLNNSATTIISNRFFHRIPPESHELILREFHRVSKNYIIIYFLVKPILSDVIFSLEKLLRIVHNGSDFYVSKDLIEEELSSSGWILMKATRVIPLLSTGFIVLAKKK